MAQFAKRVHWGAKEASGEGWEPVGPGRDRGVSTASADQSSVPRENTVEHMRSLSDGNAHRDTGQDWNDQGLLGQTSHSSGVIVPGSSPCHTEFSSAVLTNRE